MAGGISGGLETTREGGVAVAGGFSGGFVATVGGGAVAGGLPEELECTGEGAGAGLGLLGLRVDLLLLSAMTMATIFSFLRQFPSVPLIK